MQTDKNQLDPASLAGIKARQEQALADDQAFKDHKEGKTDDPRFAPKEVRLSRDHIHNGTAYKAGEKGTFPAVIADALVKVGAAGEAKGGASVDVRKDNENDTVAAINAPPPLASK